jgi:hypothetical protein
MASQPANTQISVFRTVRTRVDLGLFASIKERTQRLGTAFVMVPGEEIDTYLTLDSAGTNTPGPSPAWRFGMPVSVNTRVRSTVAEMHTDMAADLDAGALDFDKQIVGTKQDRFLQNTSAAVASDIQGDARRNAPLPRGLVEVV